MFSSLKGFKRVIANYLLWLFFLAITAFSCLLAVNYCLTQPLAISEPQNYTVAEGSNVTRVANDLAGRDVLKWPMFFRAYARFFDKAKIKAGEYRMDPSDTPMSLLNKLVDGDVIYYQITFPEGWTVDQWLQRLSGLSTVKHEISRDAEYRLDFIDGAPEGWLYPDTYSFQSGISDLTLLKDAYAKMQKILVKQWQNRVENLPYKTPYEALIMASIIEKETGVAYERAEIAGVFVRRLQKKMRLQTDPTVIYGMGSAYKGNITRRDLRKDTPFNTYVHNGLPPTPIANPGEDAIYAALHPAAGNSLYFVAKGDGSHYFSATLAEHNKAVQRYQRSQRKADYKSSPSTKK